MVPNDKTMIDLKLQRDEGFTTPHEFVPSKEAVEVGHTFDVKGKPWVVTWCQPKKPSGYLLMIVPKPR